MFTTEELKSRDFRIKLYESYYTPKLEEFKTGFIFDYVSCQFITNTCIEESWYICCSYETTPFNSHNKNELLRKLIDNKHVRAIKKNSKVRVYFRNPWWHPNGEHDEIVIMPYWKAQYHLSQSLYPGQIQILGVDHDYLSKKPMKFFRINSNKSLKEYKDIETGTIHHDIVPHFNISTDILKECLQNNKGLIFQFPDIDEVKVIPTTLFGIKYYETHPVYINGIHQHKLPFGDLQDIWFNKGKKEMIHELDWRFLLSLNKPSPTTGFNYLGQYCVAYIIYREMTLNIGSRQYTFLTKKISNYMH